MYFLLFSIILINLYYCNTTNNTNTTNTPTSPLTNSPTPSSQAPYCHVGTGLVNSNGCFSSSTLSVTNCCFNCPVTNASGSFNLCGSLYELNGYICSDQTAIAKAAQLCYQAGGASPGSFNNNIGCVSSLGLDNTQWNLGLYWNSHNNQLPPTTGPTNPTTPSTPVATNSSFIDLQINIILLISLILIVFIV